MKASGEAPGPRDIGVVVVTHCSAATIEPCLFRLLAAEGVTRVVVVDNASDDGTCDLVARMAAREPRLSLVQPRAPQLLNAAAGGDVSAMQGYLNQYQTVSPIMRAVSRCRPGMKCCNHPPHVCSRHRSRRLHRVARRG